VLRRGSNPVVLLSFSSGRAAQLTETECQVALAVARGRSNAEIARDHEVSVRTIANQVAAIFKKLGVGSRSELAATFGIGDLT
jgi:DNA-binding NarL/FixJ family response regulator